MIKFAADYNETMAIVAIATRAANLAIGIDAQFVMDLDACHSNGCPLDFDALLNANESDFVHDVAGIYRHLDRRTGTLTDCFVPRFALQDAAREAAQASQLAPRMTDDEIRYQVAAHERQNDFSATAEVYFAEYRKRGLTAHGDWQDEGEIRLGA